MDFSDATVVLQRRKNMSCNFASSSRFFFCIDDKKMLTANMPKAHHVTCTTGTGKQVLNLFYSFAVNVVWKFINPIPAGLWNDVNCRGGAIMAPD